MYNDNYHPSMTEDGITSAATYSEYDSEPYTPNEWLNSQETTPILPLPEDGSDQSDQRNDFDMQDRAVSPVRATSRRPIPGRPVAPLPDKPGWSNTPVLPISDRPGRPNKPVPPIPTPSRSVPPRPTQPVHPDWSWNRGTILLGITLSLSPARVRFYNAAVRGPVRIYVDNRPMVSSLNFLNYFHIYNAIPGCCRITVYRGNDVCPPLVDAWMSFQQNQNYIIALVGSGSNFQLRAFSF